MCGDFDTRILEWGANLREDENSNTEHENYGVYDGIPYDQLICHIDRCLLTEHNCRSPPMLKCATFSMNATRRTLRVFCLAGHSFDDGLTVKDFKCEKDGTWATIPDCQGEICEMRVVQIYYVSRF